MKLFFLLSDHIWRWGREQTWVVAGQVWCLRQRWHLFSPCAEDDLMNIWILCQNWLKDRVICHTGGTFMWSAALHDILNVWNVSVQWTNLFCSFCCPALLHWILLCLFLLFLSSETGSSEPSKTRFLCASYPVMFTCCFACLLQHKLRTLKIKFYLYHVSSVSIV